MSFCILAHISGVNLQESVRVYTYVYEQWRIFNFYQGAMG